MQNERENPHCLLITGQPQSRTKKMSVTSNRDKIQHTKYNYRRNHLYSSWPAFSDHKLPWMKTNRSSGTIFSLNQTTNLRNILASAQVLFEFILNTESLLQLVKHCKLEFKPILHEKYLAFQIISRDFSRIRRIWSTVFWIRLYQKTRVTSKTERIGSW